MPVVTVYSSGGTFVPNTSMDPIPAPNYKNPASRKPEVFSVQIAMCCASLFIVTLRIITRANVKALRHVLRSDDIVIVLAQVLIDAPLSC